MPFIRNLRSRKQNEREVLGIDVAHLFEMIKKFTDVCLRSPYKHHPVAKNFLSENHFFLTKGRSTKTDIGVTLQSTLNKIPCRFFPQVKGLASAITGSEIVR